MHVRADGGLPACLVVSLLWAPSTVAGPADPDGRYRGKLVADSFPDGGPVSFKVGRDGRRITHADRPGGMSLSHP
jgi:hypothetical protein